MTTDELRAKFEAWATKQRLPIRKDNLGIEYDLTETDLAWASWQAAHASRDAEVEALRKDVERLNWLEQDMKAGSDGTSIYYCLGKFCYPYLGSSGVGEDSASTLREAIDAVMREESK